jgi:hypothetical protein
MFNLNLNLDDNMWGFVIIVVIFILLATLSKMDEGFIGGYPLTEAPQKTPITTTGSVVPQNVNLKVNWFDQPSKQLPSLIQEFGLPDLIDVNHGGLALWKQSTLIKKGCCWNRVILDDQPNYFITIAYSYPLFRLRGQLELTRALDDIQDFNPAIMFDQVNQVLIAKGNSLKKCVVLLTLAKRLLSKEINLQQAHNLLKPMIDSTNRKSDSYDPNAYNKFKIELCSLGLPLANSLGELPSTEIFTLRPGGLEKPVKNMDVINMSD